MQAIRVHHFGGLDSLVAEDVPRPAPGDGEVLLRVKAAGVGPWDALDQVRAERSSSATSVDARVRRGRACRVRRCRGPAVQGWRCGVRRNERPIHRWIRRVRSGIGDDAREDAPANGIHRSGFSTSRRMHRMADGL